MSNGVLDQIERLAAGVLMGAFDLNDTEEIPADLRGAVARRVEEIKEVCLEEVVDIHGYGVTGGEW